MKRYAFLPIREIQPEGWLKDQLQIQLKGLSGNLDKIWPDVRDSAWIGGSREGWERVPYWLDGAIPLAFLTGDLSLQERVRRYVEAILAAQQEDGWLCPCTKEERPTYDMWALILISKTFTVWYRCTGDERIVPCLKKAMKNFLEHIRQYPLFNWGRSRWFEAFIALDLLRQKDPEPWMDELAKLLKQQGLDYPSLEERWKVPKNQWTFETHIVNLMMALKYEAVSRDLLGEAPQRKAEEMLDVLESCNGTAVGLITGDECLSGLSPVQGTEFCAAVEQAYSYEWLFAADGDPKWADRLERIAYNAFAATMTDDMWAHQYDQMANQIECIPFQSRALFRTNGGESHLFGLEPNFGCCTANFNQGWPKFAASVFMKNENELVNAAIAPCTVHTAMHGVPVTVSLTTDYPFRDTLVYRVSVAQPVRFSLGIRLPEWAEKVTVDGTETEERGLKMLERKWSGETEIKVTLTRTPYLQVRPNGLLALNYGPLTFSMPIEAEWEKKEYEKDGVERKYPYCDYLLHRKGDFGFAFASTRFSVVEEPMTDMPFGEHRPPLKILAELVPIHWGFGDGCDSVCAKIPEDCRPTGPVRRIAFQPYGSTMLRMTELPIARY